MLAKTVQRLRGYIGKVCSIVTVTMNRKFDENISREHFVVRIQEINEDGIWGQHPYNDMVSFFHLPHVISIHEELELDPNNPEHAEMIKEYESKLGKKITGDLMAPKKQTKQETGDLLPVIEKSPVYDLPTEDHNTGDASFVDIESLERLAETTKRTFDAYELLGKKS